MSSDRNLFSENIILLKCESYARSSSGGWNPPVAVEVELLLVIFVIYFEDNCMNNDRQRGFRRLTTTFSSQIIFGENSLFQWGSWTCDPAEWSYKIRWVPPVPLGYSQPTGFISFACSLTGKKPAGPLASMLPD